MCGLERIVVVSLSAGIRLLAGQASILDDASRKAIVLILSIVRFELAALTHSWCLARQRWSATLIAYVIGTLQ